MRFRVTVYGKTGVELRIGGRVPRLQFLVAVSAWGDVMRELLLHSQPMGCSFSCPSLLSCRVASAATTIVRRFVHLLRCPEGRFVHWTREGGAAYAGLRFAAVRLYGSWA